MLNPEENDLIDVPLTGGNENTETHKIQRKSMRFAKILVVFEIFYS